MDRAIDPIFLSVYALRASPILLANFGIHSPAVPKTSSFAPGAISLRMRWKKPWAKSPACGVAVFGSSDPVAGTERRWRLVETRETEASLLARHGRCAARGPTLYSSEDITYA
jgi:hypothetical protein